MITVEGKLHIKRYLAGFVPSIAESIAFGLGDKVEADTDTKLQFEVDRTDITLVSYDFVNNRLIFKAPVPEEYGGTIYEVALYSADANIAAGDFGSNIITTFDSATEDWTKVSDGTDSAFSTTARIGANALRQTPIASGSSTDALKELVLDLSGYSAADKFVLAFTSGNTFTSSINVKFYTDTSNYYQVNFGTPTTGYKIVEVAKGAAVATGTPDWSNITEIRVTTNSTAGGSATVDVDGLRIDDADTVSADYVMVSRELLSTPYVKQEGMTQDIEFALAVNV